MAMLFGRLCCQDNSSYCCQGSVDGHIETIASHTGRSRRITDFVAALKAGGGPQEPQASAHGSFLRMLDGTFPELQIYRSGRIQTSPGVEEIEGSPTEYYRTVGAMIALLSCYITANGELETGLSWVSAGERGPMSMDKVPGKFINLGNKPEQYKAFCDRFAQSMKSDEDWWMMFVFLAIHDVGKSDEFRNRVNATVPPSQRTDDHDKALCYALQDPELLHALLPSVAHLGPERANRLADGFATNFQLPQLGQGEIACCSLKGVLDLPRSRITDGTLSHYLYHSIFDIAGASSNEKFIYPLALVPVYIGFSSSMEDLMRHVVEPDRPDERGLYFEFLYSGFAKAFPDFEEATFRSLCESRVFRDETGLVFLRLMALTRNTYKNVGGLLSMLSLSFHSLVQEMAGTNKGPQIMLYYGPDMLRMGLGTDLEDASGANMRAALSAMEDLYTVCRIQLKRKGCKKNDQEHFDLNVQPIVTKIKEAGSNWKGGVQLRELASDAMICPNDFMTEGILKFDDYSTN